MARDKSDFVWYELMTPDLDGAAKFYCGLTGWQTTEVGDGNMRYLSLGMGADTRGVGGMMELAGPMLDAGVKPGWVGYLYAADVDATSESMQADGGQVCRAPADIPGVGRFAVMADPQGAIFHLFKPVHQEGVLPALGSQAVGQVGWRELMAKDWEKAWSFYEKHFFWTLSEDYDMGEAGRYQTFSTNDQPMTGGMMNIPAFAQADTAKAFWQFYLNVADIREAKTKVEHQGGVVVHGPAQVPGGGWILSGTDPQGASFALLSLRG